MLKLFDKASSLVLANITIDLLDDLDEFEVNFFVACVAFLSSFH
jgi:hypothetical protein